MKNEILGGLIEFESQEKLNNFIENIDHINAIKIIEGSIEYGMKNGLFNLNEAYCLYKCLNVIKYCVDNFNKSNQTDM